MGTDGFAAAVLPAVIGVVISWAGMRGIATLASALAPPSGFPVRDLFVFIAFSTVLGTLLIQGLTLDLLAARRTLFDLRDRGDIGDDAFHMLEDRLDWLELAGPASVAA